MWCGRGMRLTVSQERRGSLARLAEFGLSWFAFTSPIRFGQGRCSGQFQPMNRHARDVVRGIRSGFDNRMLQQENQLRVVKDELRWDFPLLYSEFRRQKFFGAAAVADAPAAAYGLRGKVTAQYLNFDSNFSTPSRR